MPKSLNLPPSQLPLVVYDSDCRFCIATIERWRTAVGQKLRFIPYQEGRGELTKIDAGQYQRAVHFVDTDGAVSSGAEAIFHAMAHCGAKRWLLWLHTTLPPFVRIAERCYSLVAANRSSIAAAYSLWFGKEMKPPTYHIAGALFLRLLGLVYLIAFISLWTQVDGLIGDQGILPTANYLEAVKNYFTQQDPPGSYAWNLPTLAWISPHNSFLHVMCGAGTIISTCLILGVLPLPSLILLWLLYLSLFHAGQVFMSFQWDILLLETGFIAIFLAPPVLRSKLFSDRHPPRLALWLVWWLLFRLMFESGVVKLTWNKWQMDASGTPLPNTWESLTALDYHYWTQPLPIWTSWYAAKLPSWFQKFSVVSVVFIELVLPWFIFGPRLLRYIAFAGIALLMILIGATGNYNFFNLLTLVLALTLLDDRAWPQFLRRRISGPEPLWLATPTRPRSFLLVPFFCLAVLIGAVQFKEAVFPSKERTSSLESALHISQFALVNDYGLFRQMTETRPEITIEGSDDGIEWKAYEFRWKPGDPARRPRFNTPHQPRLDWQMWFEALRLEQIYNMMGTVDPRQTSPWFQAFLARLFSGQPEVIGLLKNNPFLEAPPKFIRIGLDQYRFTNYQESQETGNWWDRERIWIGPAWSTTH